MKLDPDRIIASGSEIVLELSQADVAVLALELALVLGGFANGVSVVSGSSKLALRVAEQGPATTVFTREASGRVECSLSRDNAEYLQATLLRAYRDGMAEVNHIHVEARIPPARFSSRALVTHSPSQYPTPIPVFATKSNVTPPPTASARRLREVDGNG